MHFMENTSSPIRSVTCRLTSDLVEEQHKVDDEGKEQGNVLKVVEVPGKQALPTEDDSSFLPSNMNL